MPFRPPRYRRKKADATFFPFITKLLIPLLSPVFPHRHGMHSIPDYLLPSTIKSDNLPWNHRQAVCPPPMVSMETPDENGNCQAAHSHFTHIFDCRKLLFRIHGKMLVALIHVCQEINLFHILFFPFHNTANQTTGFIRKTFLQ